MQLRLSSAGSGRMWLSNGASHVDWNDRITQQHDTLKVPFVKASAGVPELCIRCAVFKHSCAASRTWVDVQHLWQELGLVSKTMNGSIWFQRGLRGCWPNVVQKLDLGELALRKSLQYAVDEEDDWNHQGRVRPYCSVNLGMLLHIVFSSVHATSRRYGLADAGNIRNALNRVATGD